MAKIKISAQTGHLGSAQPAVKIPEMIWQPWPKLSARKKIHANVTKANTQTRLTMRGTRSR